MEPTRIDAIAGWGTASQVFDRLPGRWTLRREIPGMAEVQGQACFVRRADGELHYRETVQTRLQNGQIFEGSREYRYRLASDGFEVWFVEQPPRLFHHIALRAEAGRLVGSAGHLCAADQYDSRYAFEPGGGFYVEHRVRGPRKDYLAQSWFHRVGSCGPSDPSSPA